MKRFMKYALNIYFKLVIVVAGFAFSISVLGFGFLYFPDIVTKTDAIMGTGITFPNAHDFVFGLLPSSFIMMVVALSVYILATTVRLLRDFNVTETRKG